MKRVYKDVGVAPVDGGVAVCLDGRSVRTPKRHELVVPTMALAEAIAEELRGQGVKVDPHTMPLMRLAATAIDIGGPERAAVVAQVAGYAATDLVCYRTEHPPELVERQAAAWQPLVDWAITALDARLVVTRGVVPVAQPEAAIGALGRAVEACEDWRLVALGSATKASGSLVIALALMAGRLDAEAAWVASQIDETFEIERWGEDAEAMQRRAALKATIAQAQRFRDMLG
ncbi:MAG: ATPase [Alphaproteobacteria bacterium]|nr:ATPase [Alphaproteobacteria bacterium]